ncbi:MAG: hypothetical protein JNG86_20670 [Verrucomicrobiaceae bacterium]|nr:hypothetical protein [Verrucomicrobiaceae bacterium]
MSEPDNTQNPSSTPKTSAVPLKKETVRITLRARPGAGVTQAREATSPVSPVTGSVTPSSATTSAVPVVSKTATAPIQLPSAPLPPPAPKSATAPVKLPAPPMPPPSKKTTSAVPVVAAPAPSAPSSGAPVPPPARPPVAPTAPGAPRPPGAPTAPRPPGAPPPTASLPAATRPLAQNPAAPAAPRVETGAPTVPLTPGAPKPMAPKPPGSGSGTGPMVGGGTAPLPKATVKLAPTQAMQRPAISAPPSAPVKRSAAADSEQFYEEKDPEAGLMPLSAICFVLAAALLVVQMFGADLVQTDVAGGASPIMVPEPGKQKWETKSIATGVWSTTFERTELPSIP